MYSGVQISSGLYGNALVDTSNPFIIANIIESDCKSFMDSFGTKGIGILNEAEEDKGKKTFGQKVKGFFQKILDFLKKVWGKIVSFFRNIRDKIFKKKSNQPSDSDKSSKPQAPPDYKKSYSMSNYIMWSDAISLNYNRVFFDTKQEKLKSFATKDIVEFAKNILENKNSMDDVMREINKTEKDVLESSIKELKSIFNTGMDVSACSNGAIKEDVSGNSLGELSTYTTSKFNEIFKYISENKVNFTIIATNGITSNYDFDKDAIDTYRGKVTNVKVKLSYEGIKEIYEGILQLQFNKLKDIYTNIEKQIKDNMDEAAGEKRLESIVDDLSNFISSDKSLHDFVDDALGKNDNMRKNEPVVQEIVIRINNAINGMLGRTIGMIISINNIIFTNCCKIISGASNNYRFLAKCLHYIE